MVTLKMGNWLPKIMTVQTQKDGEYQERTVTITLKAMPQENTETKAQ